MNTTDNQKNKIDIESLPYRSGVGLMIFNTNGDVFIGERLENPGSWQMPQGGIDEEDGDDIYKTIYRELYEETGIVEARVKILKITESWLYYDLPDFLIPKVWNGQFRGQKQKWVALEFTGHDAEINLNAFRHPEFKSWKWAPIDEALDIIIQFKRHTYEAALKDFETVLNTHFPS